MHTGRIEEARARVRQVEATAGDVSRTCIALGLLHARAVLADDDRKAADRFDEALGADLTNGPFQRARRRAFPRYGHGVEVDSDPDRPTAGIRGRAMYPCRPADNQALAA